MYSYEFQLPVANTIGEKVPQSDLMIGEGSPDDNSNNASESEIVKLNRSSDIIDDDTSTSSLINIANKQPPIQEHMEDSSSPHSSMSPADVAIADQKQQLQNVSANSGNTSFLTQTNGYTFRKTRNNNYHKFLLSWLMLLRN